MILVRHGQTLFNLHYGATRQDPGIEDPGLTDLGREQAAAAAATLAPQGIEALVASPYRRALETADIIAGVLGVPVAIEPLVRERAAFICDIGTPSTGLARLWPHYRFDHIEEIWWRDLFETEAELDARCGHFRARMAAQPGWDRIAVVTHWGVIRSLTGERAENGQLLRFDPTAPPVPT